MDFRSAATVQAMYYRKMGAFYNVSLRQSSLDYYVHPVEEELFEPTFALTEGEVVRLHALVAGRASRGGLAPEEAAAWQERLQGSGRKFNVYRASESSERCVLLPVEDSLYLPGQVLSAPVKAGAEVIELAKRRAVRG